MKPGNFPRRKKQKRDEAEARNSLTAEMSVKDRIAHLDSKLGKGKGAKKERARLAKMKAR